MVSVGLSLRFSSMFSGPLPIAHKRESIRTVHIKDIGHRDSLKGAYFISERTPPGKEKGERGRETKREVNGDGLRVSRGGIRTQTAVRRGGKFSGLYAIEAAGVYQVKGGISGLGFKLFQQPRVCVCVCLRQSVLDRVCVCVCVCEREKECV